MNRQFQFNHPVWEIIAFSSPEKWNEMNNARISIRDYWRIKEKYKREMDILCKQVGRIRKKYRKTYDTDTLKQLFEQLLFNVRIYTDSTHDLSCQV